MTSVISQRPQVNADELLPVGTRVRFVLSAKAYEGFVAYAGETEFSDGLWLGVVLDEASGKNDGEVQGKRYFECAPLHGMFIRPGVVTRANKARKSAEDLLRQPRSKIIRRAKSTGELQEDDDAERAKLSLTAPAGKVVRKKLSISTKKKKKNNVVNGDRPEHNDCASESGESTGSSAASEHCELGEPQSHSIDCTQLLSSTRRRSSKMRRSLDEQAHLEVEQLKNDLVEARMELAAQFSEENARKATLSEQTAEMASLTAKLKAADDEYAIKLREAMIEKNEAMVERNEEMVGRSEASAAVLLSSLKSYTAVSCGRPSLSVAMPRSKGGKGSKGGGKSSRQLPDEDEDDLDMEGLGVPLDAVVKVWCVHSVPNFSLPWQRRRQERSTGSGFCIDLSRRAVLTNAHCVEWQAQVKLQRRGSDVKYLAKVLSVGWECDAALLTVEDDEFWEGMQAVKLCERIPHLEDGVLCVGFPVGGDTISVTSGVISRVEVTTYTQAAAELLGIQIDAAINSGNSGGPAFDANGECIGVAFQSMGADEAENIGYVIPTAVIMHFLTDLLKNGKYTGFPTLGADHQTMENPHLRDAFGMNAHQKGILVSRINPTSTAASVLKTGDVLLAFDGEQIGNDGTVRFRKHERVMYTWLVAQKFYGDSAKLSVLRDGQKLELTIESFQPEERLVPIHLFDKPRPGPSYLIVAGLLFTTLSEPFLESEFGPEWDHKAPVPLVKWATSEHGDSKGKEIVVLTQVLAHELTIGYETIENYMVLGLGGVPVENLRHLRRLIDTYDSGYLKFELYDSHNKILVLKAEEAKRVTPEILKKHGIPAAMSPDLRD